MKDKIERLSKGDFEYELPLISLSEEEIKIVVEAGKIYEGSFIVSNTIKRSMKGVIYSSSRLLTIINNTFVGVENNISFKFDATILKADDRISGELTIVSDCGEIAMPLLVQVEAPYSLTSLGKIRELSQFSNLARMDWSEAKKIFRSEDFERVILSNEEKYKSIYRNLLKSISTSQALEEFLIAINKKSKINLDIDKTNVDYGIKDEEVMDKLILTKNHWGYAEIRVSTDAPFIQLEQKFVWADRFIGNTHQISYIINPDNLRPGNNYGRIWIKTVHQTLVVDVVCRKKRIEKRKNTKLVNYQLVNNYLNFCQEKISREEYLVQSNNLLSLLPASEDGLYRTLMQIHIAIVSGRERVAAQLLEEIGQNEAGLRKKDCVGYCTYLYLLSLHHKDEETTRYVTETIRRFYNNGCTDWRILWFLIYMDQRYERNRSLKLYVIKEQFSAGCNSPVMFYEAVCIFNEEPFLLREITDFEIQVINYGIKTKILSKDTIMQYTYLIKKLKKFDNVIFVGLTKLYDEYKDDEILSAICSMLIRGLKKSGKYYKWFQLGVDAQLRITELYEYFIYSMDDTKEYILPQSVLLYFIYNSNLNDRKKAFLYASIIRNKEENDTIYRSYYKKIEAFALQQLEAHNISKNLAVLYHEFFSNFKLGHEIAINLPYIMFTYELTCTNPNMVSVIVVHKELNEEENHSLTASKAKITLYNKSSEIYLVDAYGNRYYVSAQYILEEYLKLEEYKEHLVNYSNHPMLLLNLYEKYQAYNILSEKSIDLRKQVLQIDGLTNEAYVTCLLTLVDYLYDIRDDIIEKYILKLDITKLGENDRLKVLEYLILHENYERALETLDYFDYDKISINKLLKLCSGLLPAGNNKPKQEKLLGLCYYVFARGKYTIELVEYLVKYLYGPSKLLYDLWQAGTGYGLNVDELDERLLVQLLFSESYVQDSHKIFIEYYKEEANRNLVRAYLTYYAYKYLVHGRVINTELFPIMRKLLNYEENDICLLAWLKYNATNNDMDEEDISFIDYSIHKLDKKGYCLPFLSLYRKHVKLPEKLLDRSYIEYTTDPKRQVYLHYRLLRDHEEDEYITERLPNVFMGIHVKDFMLFYNETLQYYITEEADGDVNVTESFHLKYDAKSVEENDSRFNLINMMLMAVEMKDDITLLDMMEQYVETDYIITQCIKPIE